MFKKIFKKQNIDSKNILVASLLIHAAKIDEIYTDAERKIIKKALIDLNLIDEKNADELLKNSEEKEKEANQIVEFTKEIKKIL